MSLPKTLEITVTVHLPIGEEQWFLKNDDEALDNQAEIVMDSLRDYHNEISYKLLGDTFWHDTRQRLIPRAFRKLVFGGAV